jgi:hypothetical protein
MNLVCFHNALMATSPTFGLTADWPSRAAQQVTDGPIGSVSQPMTLGNPASIDTQRTFGWVTIGNRCSGTLVNRYWMLSADYCVASSGVTAGALDALTNLKVIAPWSVATVTRTTGALRHCQRREPQQPRGLALLFYFKAAASR